MPIPSKLAIKSSSVWRHSISNLPLFAQLISWVFMSVELKRDQAKGASSRYQLKYDQFDQVGDDTIICPARNVDGYAEPIQTTLTVPKAGKRPAGKLTGGVNSDGTVNIFDLVVISAGSFRKTGAGIMGDVNADGSVNIFDLVINANAT